SNVNQKYITTYFRKVISIPNPAAYPYMIAKIKRDDGVVVYVNNQEVYRNNMKNGNVKYNTLASTAATDNGTAEQIFNIAKTYFVAGNNTIAVEVHQQAANTPDMAFDMTIGTPELVPPAVVSINRQ